ncbi:MAG: hypothetical protein KBD01_15505 [Acidobacteria bacterium]|nr:hypothetical protein [Acidobacteriota bacterium]
MEISFRPRAADDGLPFESELPRHVRREVEQRLRRALEGVLCPRHHRPVEEIRVLVSATDPVIELDGCCNLLLAFARDRLLEEGVQTRR